MVRPAPSAVPASVAFLATVMLASATSRSVVLTVVVVPSAVKSPTPPGCRLPCRLLWAARRWPWSVPLQPPCWHCSPWFQQPCRSASADRSKNGRLSVASRTRSFPAVAPTWLDPPPTPLTSRPAIEPHFPGGGVVVRRACYQCSAVCQCRGVRGRPAQVYVVIVRRLRHCCRRRNRRVFGRYRVILCGGGLLIEIFGVVRRCVAGLVGVVERLVFVGLGQVAGSFCAGLCRVSG